MPSAARFLSSFLADVQHSTGVPTLSFRNNLASKDKPVIWKQEPFVRLLAREFFSWSMVVSPAGSSLHFLCSRQRTSRENHTAAVAEFNRESRKKSSCNVETLTMERLLIEYKDELEIYFLVSFAVFFIGVHKFFSWRAICLIIRQEVILISASSGKVNRRSTS